jgi:Tannase and feruloyl esterase
MVQSLSAPTNPDLRQFKRAGGKLLLYQGWNDQLEVPSAAIDYYETAERVIGGRAATQNFFRLFVIPGMGHCGGGEGADDIGYLSYLEAWVENGGAPDKMIGAHVDVSQFMKSHDENSDSFAADYETFRNDPNNVQFTRPIYPYPQRAKYRGTGDPNDASSFVGLTPALR